MYVALPNTMPSAASRTPQSSSVILSTAITLTWAPASRAPAATASASTAVCPKPEWYAMAIAGAAISKPLCDMSVRLRMWCSLISFETTCRPVWQLVAGEVGLQPVQERVRATEESGRVADAETAVGEPQQCAVAVGGELVAHHTVLDDRLFPFVFEHMGRVPDQDSAG